MKTCFIFCHGWGFDKNFWTPMAQYFDQKDIIIWDLGYFGKQKNFILEDTEIEFIGIGHSLGLIKLLKSNVKFKYLIGIQSFINFLGFDNLLHQRRKKELKTMQRHFNLDPHQTLNHFYDQCSVSIGNNKNIDRLNQNRLSDDLENLHLSHQLPKSTPLLILFSKSDRVVPPEVMYDNFGNAKNVKLKPYDQVNHCLGLRKPKLVYKSIMSFLNEHV